IFDSFKSISFDFRFDDSYGHHNLDGTPVWQYQFGFRRDPGVSEDTTFGKILQAPNIKKTRGIDGSLNLDILQNLQSSFTYNYQKVDNQHNEQRTQSISNTVFFTGDDPDANEKFWWDLIPDWRFSLTGVESFPLFNLFARTATLEHSRKGRFTESSRFENEQKNRDNWSYSINYQPFIGISVNTQWGVTATIRSTRSVTFDYR
ncbi:MAG: hypothetical protein GWN62_09295, partial [Aliifodinibius sp.]|nr:hypothetical protein [Fodinibius sp.]